MWKRRLERVREERPGGRSRAPSASSSSKRGAGRDGVARRSQQRESDRSPQRALRSSRGTGARADAAPEAVERRRRRDRQSAGSLLARLGPNGCRELIPLSGRAQPREPGASSNPVDGESGSEVRTRYGSPLAEAFAPSSGTRRTPARAHRGGGACPSWTRR
jgi:hypothetical protein